MWKATFVNGRGVEFTATDAEFESTDLFDGLLGYIAYCLMTKCTLTKLEKIDDQTDDLDQEIEDYEVEAVEQVEQTSCNHKCDPHNVWVHQHYLDCPVWNRILSNDS